MGCNLDATGVEPMLARHVPCLAANLVTLQVNQTLLLRRPLIPRSRPPWAWPQSTPSTSATALISPTGL